MCYYFVFLVLRSEIVDRIWAVVWEKKTCGIMTSGINNLEIRLKFVVSPDVILCGWLGSKHQLPTYLTLTLSCWSYLCLIGPRREAGDVWCLPPVWNLRAVIWFHFAISSLYLLPSPVTLSVLSFSASWPFLLNFFQKILQYFSLRDRLFCMAPV